MSAGASSLRLWQHRLFATPLQGVITLALLVFVVWTLTPLVRWALINATWTGETRNDCTPGGACWVFIRARIGQFMYGFYPADERWRPNLLGLVTLLATVPLFVLGGKARLRLGLAALVILPPLGIWLIGGGYGLTAIETRQWGGLMLTLFIAVYSGLVAVPLGILLALGRQSRLPLIRTLSVVFIEFWRGVPIIAVIFLASLLLPLVMPTGVSVDRLTRAVIGLGLVIAAYMAEAVRGGLQALPKGQAEAASALGLGYWQTTGLITLPQALRISLPAMTNEFIALVKNTTLVLVVSILDLLGIAQSSLADPAWVGMNMEAYLFSGTIYWLICFSLSRWSRSLETRGPKSH
ncbi:MAG: amino acid ABC transporter permease [Beijerinckiaceae bacterium]